MVIFILLDSKKCQQKQKIEKYCYIIFWNVKSKKLPYFQAFGETGCNCGRVKGVHSITKINAFRYNYFVAKNIHFVLKIYFIYKYFVTNSIVC